MGVNLVTALPSDTLHDLATLRHIEIGRYYLLATLSAAIWDWIICLVSEYELLWNNVWNWTKVLYVMTRYGGLASLAWITISVFHDFSHSACSKLAWLSAGSAVPCFIASEILLAMRVVALWKKNRGLLIILPLLIGVGLVVMIVGAAQYRAAELPPGAAGCLAIVPSDGRGMIVAYWIFPCIINLLLFVLTLLKCIEYWRMSDGGSPLLRLMIRDGTMYFFGVFGINLVNVVFFAQSNESIQGMNAPFAIALSSILCSRLVLNLRASSGNLSMSVQVPSCHNVAPLNTRKHLTIPSVPIQLRGFRAPEDLESAVGGNINNRLAAQPRACRAKRPNTAESMKQKRGDTVPIKGNVHVTIEKAVHCDSVSTIEVGDVSHSSDEKDMQITPAGAP